MPATIRDMGKRKSTDSDSARKPGSTDVIRVESDLAKKLGIIAQIRNRSVSDLVSPTLRPLVERWYAEALREAEKLKQGEDESPQHGPERRTRRESE